MNDSQKLRQLADWLEANPEVPVKLESVGLKLAESTADNFHTAVKGLGINVNQTDNSYFVLSGDVAECPVFFLVWKNTVAKKRKVMREVEEFVLEDFA